MGGQGLPEILDLTWRMWIMSCGEWDKVGREPPATVAVWEGEGTLGSE